MATLYISESSTNIVDSGGGLQISRVPWVAEQTVAISGSSTQSAAFNAATRFIRLHTDVVCSIEFGSNPTATTSTARMGANQTEYFAVPAGTKVAVISNT